MKHTTHAVAVTALAAVALAVADGAAHADQVQPTDPDKLTVQLAPGVSFTGAASDGSSVLTTPAGTVTTRDGQVAVQDATGIPMLGAPLETVASNTDITAAAAAPEPVAGTGDVLGNLTAAWHSAGAYTGLAAGVGGTAGALIGTVVGCPIGVITLGSMATVMSAAALTVPGMIGGCLAGAATTAAFGGMVGSVAVGLPVGLAVTARKFNEIQSGHAPAAPQH
ncbi:hypothetical protein [Nocardia sp. alder85J]|uniref:hypothetical protein n=1 Tax=Nocardia sp. alder85J TaxID=2862949 RepID=UPI001CD34654|nr:hypothetical protein [Nocardia sp. alder85J]MCX4090787.1 hypothetical protein [Nocardia sp. alder85J]